MCSPFKRPVLYKEAATPTPAEQESQVVRRTRIDSPGRPKRFITGPSHWFRKSITPRIFKM